MEAVGAEAREKLKLYREIGYLGAGTFAEVSRYVRLSRRRASRMQRRACVRDQDCRWRHQRRKRAANPKS